MASSPSKRSSSFSERLYRLFLLSYPAKFREAYSDEMLQTFRSYQQEFLQQDDKWGAVRLWSFMTYDLAKTVVIEHWREFDTHLKRFFAISELRSRSTVFLKRYRREIYSFSAPTAFQQLSLMKNLAQFCSSFSPRIVPIS